MPKAFYRAGLAGSAAAGDLSAPVFIKVAEVRVGEGGPSPTDYREFGRIAMTVAVAISSPPKQHIPALNIRTKSRRRT